jgi:hypothetical protein
MVSFIDAHRKEYGVESICRVLPIAPSMYYEHEARRKKPELLPARAKRDADLRPQIRREQQEVYGVRSRSSFFATAIRRPTYPPARRAAGIKPNPNAGDPK